MRQSLRQSVADTPATGFERYQKGSIVVCNACAKPVFKLDRAIDLGDKAGQSASAFKPVTDADLTELAGRADVDAGLRATITGWKPLQRQKHLQSLREMKSGDPMMCPACGDCFVQVLSVEKHEVLDRAYTIEMLTVPPFGAGKPSPLRGKRLGAAHEWLHENKVN